MNLIFRAGIVFVFCLSAVQAQEQLEDVAIDSTKQQTHLRFHFDLGAGVAPQAAGDNFIANGYDLTTSFDLAATFEYNYLTFHLNFTRYKGDVTDPTVTGNYTSTRFSRSSLGIGYPWKVSNRFTINPSIHYGEIRLKSNLIGTEELKDNGQFIGVGLKMIYEFTDWFSLYAGMSGYQDFLRIKTPSAIQKSFDRALLIVPVIGLRFSSSKTSRKKGEKGDGIFTRRDGL